MADRRLTVVVCAHGESTKLTSCLASLHRAGIHAPRIISGSTESSLLLNAALAECSTELIAFVDDDVDVDSEWLSVINAAWAGAATDVACVAGSITPSFIGDRPDWLSDPLLGVINPEGQQANRGKVDVATKTFPRGNLTLRVSAARGVGGFWPTRGAGPARDLLSEEHHLQHQLARAGWQTLYEPDAKAIRVIDSSTVRALDLLKLYARTTSRANLIDGSAGHSNSISSVARSSLGATIAAATGRKKLAVQRATRAVERASARAPVAIAGKTMDPVSSSTPFLHSIASAKLDEEADHTAAANTIICFHGVSEDRSAPAMNVTPEALSAQLEALLAAGVPASLDEIAAGAAPKNAFAVTFDDGYANNLHVALPILEAAGIPATFFIATGHIGSGSPFWWDEVDELLSHAAKAPEALPVLELECGGQLRAWALSDSAGIEACKHQIVAWFQQRLQEEIEPALAQLRAWLGPTAPEPSPDHRALTVDELRTLAASPLATIGAHTRSHPCLLLASPERRREELVGARNDLEQWTGVVPTSLAYPYGIWGSDVNQAVVAAARDCGYSLAVVNGPGPSGRNPLALARVLSAQL